MIKIAVLINNLIGCKASEVKTDPPPPPPPQKPRNNNFYQEFLSGFKIEKTDNDKVYTITLPIIMFGNPTNQIELIYFKKEQFLNDGGQLINAIKNHLSFSNIEFTDYHRQNIKLICNKLGLACYSNTSIIIYDFSNCDSINQYKELGKGICLLIQASILLERFVEACNRSKPPWTPTPRKLGNLP